MWNKTKNMTPEEQTAYYRSWFKEIRSLAITAAIIFTFYSSCYQPQRVPTGSMIPTIMIGDYILVDNSAYGLKFPFSDHFGAPLYLTAPSDPKRGEVVVFRYPENPRLNYIKRVIGLPGDVIEMRNWRWVINGEVQELYGPHTVTEPEMIEKRFFDFGLEEFDTLTGNHPHKVLYMPNPRSPREINSFTLKEDEYFMVGDNRDFSEDSRHWGVVHRSAIKGRALFTWFSFVGPFSGERPRIKWGRIGTPLNAQKEQVPGENLPL